MRPPAAIGYIRQDVSGTRQHWDEIRIRSLAKDFGYNLTKTVVFGADVDDPARRLRNVANNMTRVHGVEIVAVLTPSLEHLGGDAGMVIEWCDEVVTVDGAMTYSRTESDGIT